jgi:hypothetical protein
MTLNVTAEMLGVEGRHQLIALVKDAKAGPRDATHMPYEVRWDVVLTPRGGVPEFK